MASRFQKELKEWVSQVKWLFCSGKTIQKLGMEVFEVGKWTGKEGEERRHYVFKLN